MAIGSVVAWFAVATGLGATTGTAWWLAGTCAAACAVSVALAGPALRARHLPPSPSRAAGLIGEVGRAVAELAPTGVVQLRGETWTAESLSGTIAKGADVRVISLDGVKLRVWTDQELLAGADELLPKGET